MQLIALTVLPIIAGLATLLFKHKGIRANVSFFAFAVSLFVSLSCLVKAPAEASIGLLGNYELILGLNKIGATVLFFINLFGLLTCLYAKSYGQDKGLFFPCLLFLISFSNLAILSMDFITFIFAWGSTLIMLYVLLFFGSGEGAKKAFSIVGFADFCLIAGVCLYIISRGTTIMPEKNGLILSGAIAWFSFAFMLIAALAKAGCAPFHTWIPEAAEKAPIPVMAILPASLDKLLGIYLLARICVDFFVLNSIVFAVLLVIGSLTILFAVMMALIQHDLRKLLSFHAISQVGYMVLGFGTGTPAGIMGGLFHMINNALYKTGLFLSGGAVGEEKKSFDLDKLGGLAVYMPVTFACALVFSLSISGVPPFNGFASKWLLYQGVIIGLEAHSSLTLRFIYIFALICAMFGSALTLASFIKFMHAIFLGQEAVKSGVKPKESPANMLIPLIVLAVLCIALGAFPAFFVSRFIEPWLGQGAYIIGSWDSVNAFIFLVSGIVLGVIIWAVSHARAKLKQDTCFIGGETSDLHPTFPATEFYRTIETFPFPARFYRIMKKESFDFYNLLSGLLRLLGQLLYLFVDRFIYALTNIVGYFGLGLSWALRSVHTGVLDFYLVWSLFGLALLFFILMGR